VESEQFLQIEPLCLSATDNLHISKVQNRGPFLLIVVSPFLHVLPTENGTYPLTPWSRVLLDKLTVNFAASQKIPRIYGTRNFLTVPTSAQAVNK
jgi:hypothetical protein